MIYATCSCSISPKGIPHGQPHTSLPLPATVRQTKPKNQTDTAAEKVNAVDPSTQSQRFQQASGRRNALSKRDLGQHLRPTMGVVRPECEALCLTATKGSHARISSLYLGDNPLCVGKDCDICVAALLLQCHSDCPLRRCCSPDQ